MESAGYMQVNASKQGTIAGSSLRKNRENLINLYSFNHQVSASWQAHSHISNGEIIHAPISITKEIDRSTPKLFQAMVEKEVLNIELEWFRFNVNGKEERYFKIELKDAQLLSINQMMPEIGDKRSEQLRLMESIFIAYSEITWSWGPFGDIAYQTNWRGER